MSLPDAAFRVPCQRTLLTLLLVWLTTVATLHAGGPRWVTGPPYFTTAGVDVVWYTNQPLYFTDPGDLSPNVNHAAADALVAAAASVWNVPTSSLVLAQGGNLAEHVSGSNAFLGSAGPIFPSDVQSSNYQNIQIAVIYDSDGSITDLLLGNGASDPTGCLQNGVTESVDSFAPAGFIKHAILVLNGRCTGSNPDQQTQLQYQLMRAFGRILGLGWSQTNDNVFTGSPEPTFNQAMNWPVMYPIDIICGPYTFKCRPQPFTLRADDLSALAELYFITQGTAAPGKTDSLLNANLLNGQVLFPNNQGMQGVNVVARRWAQFTGTSQIEDWYTASSVSGYLFRHSNGNPVTGPDTTFNGSLGATQSFIHEGWFNIQRIPMLPGGFQSVILETEPINPLYTGQYTVGPYTAGAVEPSGSDNPQTLEGLFSYVHFNDLFSTSNPASDCNTAADGIESAPAAAASTGWWTDQLCGYGHAAWSSFSVKANRTLTLEVTAEDEQGFATTAKAMPVIGLWNATDILGTLPSVAAAGEPFNGEATGLTTLSASFTQPDQLRMVIADQRGDGRPDFNYQARVLYADTISPATVGSAGGTITISGMGFRTGNTVTINGVPAIVSSWTANTITAIAPSLQTLGATTALAANVTITDLSTGGTTTMAHALNYGTPVPALSLLSAPSGTVVVGQTPATPFAVQVLNSDGITPVVGEAVTFTATTGSVQFTACAAATCTLHTNTHGIASTLVTPQAPGTITLQATGIDGTATASFTAIPRVQTLAPLQPIEYIAARATVTWTPQLTASDNAASTVRQPILWQPVSGPVTAAPTLSQVNAQDIAQTQATAGPLAPQAQAILSACAWTSICTTFTTQGVDPSELRLTAISGATQTIPATGAFTPVILQVIDVSAHPVAGAVVQIYQTIDAWQLPCPDRGRCPIPPVLASSQYPVTSDANGLLTILPQHLAGIPGTTNLAAATGTQAFLSLTLQAQP